MFGPEDMVAQYVLFVLLLTGVSLYRRHGPDMENGNVGPEPEATARAVTRRRPRRRRLKEVDGYVVLVAVR